MNRLAVLALLGLAACGAFRRENDSPTAQRLRLCVQNATVGYGNITAHADLVRFDVMPGQEVCKMVPASGPSLVLTASTMGGGTTGPLRYGTRLQPTGPGCWRWRLSDSPTSSIDLLPCEQRNGSSGNQPAP
ncbi:MAG TPA: hypothetical protein VFS20_08300 [Longimicrobium sp.]|nr:hypothetical protein [Longimicrobium sp.]